MYIIGPFTNFCRCNSVKCGQKAGAVYLCFCAQLRCNARLTVRIFIGEEDVSSKRCTWYYDSTFLIIQKLTLHNFYALHSFYSCNIPWRSIGLWDVEDSTYTYYRQSALRWRWGCKPYEPGALYPHEDSWHYTLFIHYITSYYGFHIISRYWKWTILLKLYVTDDGMWLCVRAFPCVLY
jgi:hypothetical protein